MRNKNIVLTIFCISLSVKLLAQQVFPGGGLGSYNLTFPPGPYTYPNNPPSVMCGGGPAVSHYQRPGHNFYRSAVENPKVVAGFSQHPQTNDWWTSAIWNYETNCNWVIAPYSFWMFPHPLQVGATRYGLRLTYEDNPVIVPNLTYYHHREPHLYVGLSGMDIPAATGTKVKNYSDWAVTMQWNDGTRNMEATSAHGSPYVYFTKDVSSTYTLRYQVNPGAPFATINNANVVARGVTILGKHYGIFLPPGSTFGGYYALNYNEGNVVAEVPTANVNRDATNLNLPVGHNYFSIAVLPDNNPATLAYYAQFAFAFITNTEVSWNYNDANAMVESNFTITTSPQGISTETQTLSALYRHQWLNTSTPLTAYSYVSPRGQMRVTQGNSFQTQTRNSGLLTALPWKGSYDSTTLYNYVQAEYANNLNNVAYHMNHFASAYDVGVKIDRIIALIHTAHQVGHYVARDKFRDYLKTALQHWLSAPAGKSNQMFWYDPLWKTLVAYPSAFESDRQLNDHHFHYAYLIKGAATVVQYEPNNTWFTQWGPMVEMLIRDVSAWDRADTQFPFLRNFDPYAGHSWASGHANFNQGNNQESSSEAVNYGAAVAFWGTNTGNATLRNLGLFLYTTEVAATQQYWFDVNETVFSTGFLPEATGMVWGRSAEYQTWFSGDPEHIHGINYLPISGNSYYLAWDTLYPQRNYNYMVARNGGVETAGAGWRDLFWMYQALYDPATAKAKFAANAATYIPQTGQSKPYTYQWIHTLDSIGKPQAHITANTATYGVFKRDQCYYYVVYNPPSTIPGNTYAGGKTVTFSDGFSAFVPDDTTIVFRNCGVPLPINLLNFSAKLNESKTVDIEWITLSEKNNDYFIVEKSLDGISFEPFIKVKGKANATSLTNYTLIDENPYLNWTYYRLKQVDLDGNYTYSGIEKVRLSNSPLVHVFPNPANNYLNIQVLAEEKENSSFQIFDLVGHVVYSKDITLVDGINNYRISTDNFARGTYVLQLNFQNEILKPHKIILE